MCVLARLRVGDSGVALVIDACFNGAQASGVALARGAIADAAAADARRRALAALWPGILLTLVKVRVPAGGGTSRACFTGGVHRRRRSGMRARPGMPKRSGSGSCGSRDECPAAQCCAVCDTRAR